MAALVFALLLVGLILMAATLIGVYAWFLLPLIAVAWLIVGYKDYRRRYRCYLDWNGRGEPAKPFVRWMLAGSRTPPGCF